MLASTDIQWRDVEIAKVSSDGRGGWWLTLIEEGAGGRFHELSCRCDRASYERIRAFAARRGFSFDLASPAVVGMGAHADIEPQGSDWKLLRVKEALISRGPYGRWCDQEREKYRRARRLSAVPDPRELTVEGVVADDLASAMRGKRCLVIAPEGAEGLSDIVGILTRNGAMPGRIVVSSAKLQASPEEVAASIREALRRADDDIALAIVARGGGSRVQRTALDSSVVAEAIASAPVPVICAIGHEGNVHLADRAATYSAATPSDVAHCLLPILRESPGGQQEAHGREVPLAAEPPHAADATRVMPNAPTPERRRENVGVAGTPATQRTSAPRTSPSKPPSRPVWTSSGSAGRAAPMSGFGALPQAPGRWPRRLSKYAAMFVVACLLFFAVLRPMGRWFSSLGQGASSAPQHSARIVHSHSGNIICELTNDSVRCDIDRVEHSVPPVPKRCSGTSNWGHVYVVTKLGVDAQCPQERRVVASTQAQDLPYGDSVTVGDAMCSDASTGMTCTVGRHGITLSKGQSKTW